MTSYHGVGSRNVVLFPQLSVPISGVVFGFPPVEALLCFSTWGEVQFIMKTATIKLSLKF